MSQKNIILTGFMGTGKSTLGRLLAKSINYDFVDTDTEIENREGRSIEEIFKQDGEASFRKLESNLVTELAQMQGLVIATGGGLVVNPNNVEALEQTGQIICLTASAEEILDRVSNQQTVRPLLQEADPQAKIVELLQQRATIYQQFLQLSTSHVTIDKLLDKLLKLISDSYN